MIRQTIVALGILVAGMSSAAAQNGSADPKRFVRFLGSQTYSSLLGNKALDVDEKMPPLCKRRQLVGRKLFAIADTPRFIAQRDVPVSGRWAERVSVSRCGRTVEHNIFFVASRVRGIVAIAGFPGRSLTDLALQAQAGRSVLRAARGRAPACRRMEIVNMQITTRPERRGAAWAEVWTVWACGKRLRQRLRFNPSPGGGVSVSLG